MLSNNATFGSMTRISTMPKSNGVIFTLQLHPYQSYCAVACVWTILNASVSSTIKTMEWILIASWITEAWDQTIINKSLAWIILSYRYVCFIFNLITSQDKLDSLYHGSSAELVLVGVEPETLWFWVDVITHYYIASHLQFYIFFIIGIPYTFRNIKMQSSYTC